MSGRSKITVEKREGGLGRKSPTADMISAFVMNGVATANLTLGEIYEIRLPSDLTALGITPEYDADNKVLVHHRLSRVLLRNPSVIMHVMIVAQDVTLTQMVTKEEPYLAKLLREKSGEIVQWAIARNPLEAYEPTLVTGLDQDVITAVAKAQELTDFEESKFRYADGFIEGRSFNGTATSAIDLRTLNASGVTVVIGADYQISEKDVVYNDYAAVEDALGLASLVAVSQNFGELSDDYNLTNANTEAFIEAGLSSNKKMSEYTDDALDILHDKGYVFAEAVSGEAGFWFNDSHCCTILKSDYAQKENNRTIKKAIKLVRKELRPRVKRRIYVNPANGQIAREEAKDLETTIKKALRIMETDGDISGGRDAYVNPEQNILATSKLETEVSFVPVSIGRQIVLKIGFNNPFGK